MPNKPNGLFGIYAIVKGEGKPYVAGGEGKGTGIVYEKKSKSRVDSFHCHQNFVVCCCRSLCNMAFGGLDIPASDK